MSSAVLAQSVSPFPKGHARALARSAKASQPGLLIEGMDSCIRDYYPARVGIEIEGDHSAGISTDGHQASQRRLAHSYHLRPRSSHHIGGLY